MEPYSLSRDLWPLEPLAPRENRGGGLRHLYSGAPSSRLQSLPANLTVTQASQPTVLMACPLKPSTPTAASSDLLLPFTRDARHTDMVLAIPEHRCHISRSPERTPTIFRSLMKIQSILGSVQPRG